MQKYSILRQAKYSKCYVEQLPNASEEEIILENQAVGIAPKILMPKDTFIEKAYQLKVGYEKNNDQEIAELSRFFDVSKQSVSIRLRECGLI